MCCPSKSNIIQWKVKILLSFKRGRYLKSIERKKKAEEHVTLMSQPSSEYFSHYSVHSGSTEEITLCKRMFEHFKHKDINKIGQSLSCWM